ncbi:MAG TPA: HPr family phosphocarrier protein [Planctomycetaceae bacterium]|nr:HPr family phosphocarrier protein [Planctomycetaceae bacterium]
MAAGQEIAMETTQPLERRVILAHKNGLHLTPITMLVQRTADFQCDVRLSFDGKTASAKSAVELMLLGATEGAELVVQASGADDAEAAIDCVASVLGDVSED